LQGYESFANGYKVTQENIKLLSKNENLPMEDFAFEVKCLTKK
jgi:hypothetical protein